MVPLAADDVGPLLVIATSFCCVSVVVIDAALLLVGVSVVAVSVVLMTALFTRAAVEAGRMAATMMMVLLVPPVAKFPTAKVISSGFAAVVSDADAGMVTVLPLTVALMIRIPSGILSTTCTLIASEGPLLVAVKV